MHLVGTPCLSKDTSMGNNITALVELTSQKVEGMGRKHGSKGPTCLLMVLG